MRRFKLINAIGAEFDLNCRDSFFQHPDGLGFSRSIQSSRAGYDYIITDDELDQKTPNGEIVFKTYEKYTEFVNFCAHSPLILCYMPASKWFYLDCRITRLEKSEKVNRKLICPVDFLALGTWYESKKVFRTQVSEETGKTYPYTYPYTYIETSAGSVVVNNTGKIDSPCLLHILGAVESPSWSLIRGGTTILTGKVNANIAAGNKLVVNSSPKDLEIAEYTADGAFVRDLYQDSDFSTARFLMIPPGESIIAFTHAGGGAVNAIMEVMILAESV
jgi:hypothetical protein